MQNNQIDWSKAPELATHYMPGVHFPWCKGRGGIWEFWTGNAWQSFGPSRVALLSMVERPAAWDFKGLPPVGFECEAYFPKDTVPVWMSFKALYISDHNIVALCEGEEEHWAYERFEKLKVQFRPIRTPELIAAEEREKAVTAMLALDPPDQATGAGLTSRKHFCGVLYDAGYRLVEGGAQ